MNQVITVSIVGTKDLGLIEDEVEVQSGEALAKIASKENWSPGTFDGRRSVAALRAIGLLVLDVDEGCTLDEALEIFEPYKHIIMTSKSHQKEKNGVVCDRFRVVLYLDKVITNDRDYKATWAQARALWPFIDEACKDSSRFFYPSPEIVSIAEDGELVQVVEAPAVQERSLAKPVTEGEKGDLWKSTLDFLLNGAPQGTRHTRLVSAVGNMKEQGYDLPEISTQIEDMTLRADWTQPGLSPKDLHTITDVFNRPAKYEFRPKEDGPAQAGANGAFVSASSLLDEAFEYLADKDKVKGEPSGIEGLDRLLGGGFRSGELTVLMANAKSGKNTLYHYLLYSFLKRGIPFGYASRELSPATEVLPNLLTIDTGTNMWKCEKFSEDFKRVARSAVTEWPLYFAPGYGYFPVNELEQWFRAMKEQGVSHFLFDHFHYALLGEDYEATAQLIKKLKSLTKELDIHLNLIVQPRSLRDGEKLSLATLRGGAAIGQALDNLLILERVRGQDNISRLSLEVARHKLCKLGDIFLKYDPETTRFEEVEKALVQPQGIDDPEQEYGGKFSRGSKPFKPYRLDG